MKRSKQTRSSNAPVYLLHFEARYNPAKSQPPRLARLVVASDRLQRIPVTLPSAPARRLTIRIEGTYAPSDGDLFESVDSSHAEIFVVQRGFQFAVWWGKPEDVRKAESLVTGFLSRNAESCGPMAAVLENESRLIGGADDEGRATALRELIRQLGPEPACGTI